MRRAEIWVVINNALAVVITIIVIAALFYSLPARAERKQPSKHQTTHAAPHHIYNNVMRTDVKHQAVAVSRTAIQYIESVDVPATTIVLRDLLPYGRGNEPNLHDSPSIASHSAKIMRSVSPSLMTGPENPGRFQ